MAATVGQERVIVSRNGDFDPVSRSRPLEDRLVLSEYVALKTNDVCLPSGL